MDDKKTDKLVEDIIKESKLKKLKCHNCGSKYQFSKEDIPDNCPNCDYDNFWFKPPKERELFILQKEFLDNNRNPKYLSKMYKPLQFYVRIILLKKLKNRKVLTADDVEMKVQDTVTKVIIYYTDYKKYGNWKIDDSFYGVISFILLDTLYNHKNRFWEQQSSLNNIIKSEGNNKQEVQDQMFSFGYRDIYNIECDTLKEILTKDMSIVKTVIDLTKSIIEKLEYTKGSNYALYVLTGISYNLGKVKPDYLQLFYEFVGYEVENMIKKFLEVIEDYVRMEEEIY